jgi:SWI/SNF-related matrix-associated actin-dependent regulator of chromatin subfamily A3
MVDKMTAKITICKHIFCTNCIETVIQGQRKCPMCRTALPSAEMALVSPAAEDAAPQQEHENAFARMGESSSKLDAMLHILQATREKDRGIKTIVFSQFTKFLDVIQVHLQKHNFEFVRLDGSMTPAKRDAALDTFSNSPKHTILLASLAVCSVGVCPSIIFSVNGS